MTKKPTGPANPSKNKRKKPEGTVKDEGHPVTDEDLDNVAGGIGDEVVRMPPARIPGGVVKIMGPAWVQSMAYRKVAWEAEPARERSLVELYKDLATWSADDE
jgi:hypothetical protein